MPHPLSRRTAPATNRGAARPAPRRRVARALLAVPALALVLTAAACGGDKPAADPSPSTPPPPAAALCPSDQKGGKQVRFTDEAGASLAGVELGTGSVGIVLAHTAGSDTCEWLPYGQELLAAGYRVLAFDFADSGVSDPMPANDNRAKNVEAAAKFLRSEGATTIALMGGSMGATASLVAATEIDPPVACVISLSSPLTYQGLSAASAVDKLTVPVLFAAGDADGNFADNAKTLYDATPAGVEHKLVIGYSTAHGPALLYKGAADKDTVRAAVADFLKAHAPAK